ESRLVNQMAAPIHIAIGSASEYLVEPAEEHPQRPSRGLAWTQQHRGKCGTQGERVEGGEEYRYRDGNSKLLVKLTSDSRDECRRNKHSRQGECDGDHWSRHFLHGFDGCVVR